MEEDEASISIENVIGMLIALGAVAVAGFLMYSWIFGDSADAKMTVELGRLADAVMSSEDRTVTVTRLEGYFFVYCRNTEFMSGEFTYLSGDCTWPGADPHGASAAIHQVCKERCLCLAKLPKNPNSNYLTNIVECVQLNAEADCNYEMEPGFWAIPSNCDTDSSTSKIPIQHSGRYRIKVEEGTDTGGGTDRRKYTIKNQVYLGSTKGDNRWDRNENGVVDECE